MKKHEYLQNSKYDRPQSVKKLELGKKFYFEEYTNFEGNTNGDNLNCDQTQNFTKLKLWQYFSKDNLTTQQIDEVYSGQPFAISHCLINFLVDIHQIPVLTTSHLWFWYTVRQIWGVDSVPFCSLSRT